MSAPWGTKEGSGGSAFLSLSSQHFTQPHQLPWLSLTTFFTSLTKQVYAPCPQSMPTTGNPGYSFISEAGPNELEQLGVTEGGRLSAAGARDCQSYSTGSQGLCKMGLSSCSPCHRREGRTASGNKDANSQSAGNRAGAECCSAVLLITSSVSQLYLFGSQVLKK